MRISVVSVSSDHSAPARAVLLQLQPLSLSPDSVLCCDWSLLESACCCSGICD